MLELADDDRGGGGGSVDIAALLAETDAGTGSSDL